jgi:hypothetical protein
MQEYKSTIQNRIVTNEEYLKQCGWEEGQPMYIPPEIETQTPEKRNLDSVRGSLVQTSGSRSNNKSRSPGSAKLSKISPIRDHHSPVPIVQEAFLEQPAATQINRNID